MSSRNRHTYARRNASLHDLSENRNPDVPLGPQPENGEWCGASRSVCSATTVFPRSSEIRFHNRLGIAGRPTSQGISEARFSREVYVPLGQPLKVPRRHDCVDPLHRVPTPSDGRALHGHRLSSRLASSADANRHTTRRNPPDDRRARTPAGVLGNRIKQEEKLRCMVPTGTTG